MRATKNWAWAVALSVAAGASGCSDASGPVSGLADAGANDGGSGPADMGTRADGGAPDARAAPVTTALFSTAGGQVLRTPSSTLRVTFGAPIQTTRVRGNASGSVLLIGPWEGAEP